MCTNWFRPCILLLYSCLLPGADHISVKQLTVSFHRWIPSFYYPIMLSNHIFTLQQRFSVGCCNWSLVQHIVICIIVTSTYLTYPWVYLLDFKCLINFKAYYAWHSLNMQSFCCSSCHFVSQCTEYFATHVLHGNIDWTKLFRRLCHA